MSTFKPLNSTKACEAQVSQNNPDTLPADFCSDQSAQTAPVEHTLNRADLLMLTPNTLLARCGAPLHDEIRKTSYKEILRRRISYKSANGSTVTLTFWRNVESKNWTFLVLLGDDGVEHYNGANEQTQIYATLPCLHM